MHFVQQRPFFECLSRDCDLYALSHNVDECLLRFCLCGVSSAAPVNDPD